MTTSLPASMWTRYIRSAGIWLGALSLFLLLPARTQAQVPTCDSIVPYFLVDLTGTPDSIWTSPGVVREGNCCSTSSPIRCISFEVLLDTGAVGISFNIIDGALPPGALFYQIGCGPQLQFDTTICLTGPGPHYLTFCKPGSNLNIYEIQSISKPLFPQDDTVRIGCSKSIEVLGLDTSTVTWNSVFPGAPGDWNHFLDTASNALQVTIQPDTTAPPYIDYEICGFPQADECGYILYTCDTVRIHFLDPLDVSVFPNPANFCASGVGALLTATVLGGDGNYTYAWLDPGLTPVGTLPTYTATVAGDYTLVVGDGQSSGSCPDVNLTVPVSVTPDPIVDAGLDQTLCPVNPMADLEATLTNADSGYWTGGAGSYIPSATSNPITYIPTPGEVAAGSVTLTFTSQSNGSCPDVADSLTLYFGDTLTASISGVDPLCNGDSVTLTVTANTGNGPFNYLWSNGSTSTSISTGAGSYCVTVTDALGCETVECRNVVEPPSLTATTSHTDATTIGGSDGTATVTPGGGTPPYTHAWSTGDNTASITGLSLGVYTDTITDGNGCMLVVSVVINDPRCLGFQAWAGGSSVSCFGDQTGYVYVDSIDGGLGPYTFWWNTEPVQTTDTAWGLGAGTYTLIVTDAQGCSHLDVASITEPSQISNTMTQTNNPVIGGSTGTATANPSGGTPPYGYSWSNGQTTQTATGLAAGTYYVTITDSLGCMLVDSLLITEPPCNDMEVNIIKTNVSCNGDTDGTANAVVLNATPPFDYNWNTGSTAASLINLGAGGYSVTVTDSVNCINFANTVITEPTALTIGLVPTNPRCYGEKDGSIDLSVSGGTPPYDFYWSNSSKSEDLALLGPGSYSVTVTDANGCSTTGGVILNEPTELQTSDLHIPVTCNSGSNGSIDLSVSGGVGFYSYAWSSGQSTEDISGIISGTYKVTVTDANLCTVTHTVLIDQPDSVQVDSILRNCPIPGNPFSDVTVFVSGGNGGYWQVSYDNGSTFGAQDDTTATLPVDSSYLVVAMDSAGCISAPYSLSIDSLVGVAGVSFASCFGPGVDSTLLTVNPAGGDGGPYEVSYDNGVLFGTPGDYDSTLAIGTNYDIIIRDSTGCMSVAFPINIPDSIALTLISPTYTGGWNISCNGASDGSIDLSLIGGVPGYTYAWSNGGTTQDISGLTAGTYTVTVTDTNGCTAIDSITLTEPTPVADSLTAATYTGGWNISCNGASDGSIDLTPYGGTAGYSFMWSNAATTEDISGLMAGTYTVTVTDTNGCTVIDSIALTEPTPVADSLTAATYTGGWNISCNGASDGSIDLTPYGGTAGYTFLWSNGATTEDISGLMAGTYTVTVTDTNGCTVIDSITLTEPTPVADSLVAATYTGGWNISCNGASDGSIDLTPYGGTAGYSFLWSNGATTEDISGLMAGTYTVTVTDTNGCTVIDSITLTEPTPVADSLVAATYTGGWNISCNGASDGSIDLTPYGGTAGYSFLWSNGATTEDISGLMAGTYTVTVTDTNGCTVIDSITLTEPTPVADSLTAATYTGGWNISCNGASDGSIDLTPYGGTMPYTYAWSNGATVEDPTGLSAGTYTVTLTDANGCAVIDSITLSEPPALTDSLTAALVSPGYHISCFGGSDGSVNLTVSGGTPGYTYAWSHGSANEDPVNLSAGTYTVTVTDANGCMLTDVITLSEPSALSTSALTTDAACNGDSTGAIDLTVGGGVPAYQFVWSTGATTEDLPAVPAGVYYVTVTDAHGCVRSDTVTVNEEDPIDLSAAVTDATCFGYTDGAVDLTAIGGASPYTFLWSTGATSEDLSGLPAGSYSVLVIDDNSCEDSLSVTVQEPAELSAYAGTDTTVCAGNFYLNANPPGQGETGEWSIVSGAASIVDPTVPNAIVASIGEGETVFLWTIFNGPCSVSDSVTVTLGGTLECGPYPLEMPTGYSPNGDGANDFFVIRNIEYYPNNYFQVFNRWGNKVYERQHYSNNWGGRNMNSGELPDGTYYVILNVNDGEIVLHGYVDLRR